jgi:hypothetical protein
MRTQRKNKDVSLFIDNQSIDWVVVVARHVNVALSFWVVFSSFSSKLLDEPGFILHDRIIQIIAVAFALFTLTKLIKAYFEISTLTRLSITNVPGTKLLALVEFFFSPRTVEQTFKPIVSDWHYEYFEALTVGRKWKARWISTRYRCAFVWAMSLSRVLSVWKQLRSASK